MILIIHHWDVDGICSAALIARELVKEGLEWENCCPSIGKFILDERTERKIQQAERVIFVDLNMPHVIENILKPALFIDHHIQDTIQKGNVTYLNPIAEGKSPDEFPSATWVVSEWLSEWNLWSVLGAIGDRGGAVFHTSAGQKTREIISESGLTESEVFQLVSMIDSNQILMDQKGVETAVLTVLNSTPVDLLGNEKWIRNVEVIEKEIEKVFMDISPEDDLAEIEFRSQYNIISRIARLTVWKLGLNGVIAVNSDFWGLSQIYFRIKSELAGRIDVPGLIRKLADKDFNAGGKEDVVGVICPPEKMDEVVSMMREAFYRK